MLRAYRGLSGFKGDASFRTWIRAIAENQCHTLAMRRKRHVLEDHVRELAYLHEAVVRPHSPPSDTATQRVHKTFERIDGPGGGMKRPCDFFDGPQVFNCIDRALGNSMYGIPELGTYAGMKDHAYPGFPGVCFCWRPSPYSRRRVFFTHLEDYKQ